MSHTIGRSLDVRLHAPVPEVVVVRVDGPVDAISAPLLAERVGQQYCRALHVITLHVIVDLAGATLLDVDGVAVLRDLLAPASHPGVHLYATAEHDAVCGPLQA
ncbi:MAG: STAS domain-containing protein, partial [Actinomycetes bacterium]